MAKTSFFIEIAGEVDSLTLWSLIQKFKVNLTAWENKTWIYGECELHNLGTIIERCALFGRLKVEVGGGGSIEPEETKKSET